LGEYFRFVTRRNHSFIGSKFHGFGRWPIRLPPRRERVGGWPRFLIAACEELRRRVVSHSWRQKPKNVAIPLQKIALPPFMKA
jgi:hypothetical protein